MKENPEIRLNHDGTLDEVVARDAWVHLEQMDDGYWWLGITANGKLVHVNLWSKRKIKGRAETEPA